MSDLAAKPIFDTTAPTVELNISVTPLKSSTDDLQGLVAVSEQRPFWQQPAWWQLANEHLFQGRVELIIASNDRQETLAAMPVLRQGGALLSPQHPHLTVGDSLWIGADSVCELDEIMDAILTHLGASSWTNGHLPNTSQIQLCQDQTHWQWKQVRESAWFDTTGDTPIPGKLRRNLARHQRKIEDLGELVYQVAQTDDTDELSAAMQNFLRLEASGWKGESGTDISKDANLTAFYEGLLGFTQQELKLEIHQLHLANNCIATQIALRCGRTLYLIKIAYDESQAAYSPGSLLLWQTMQRCVEDDTQTLSLVSAPNWASRWKPNVFPVWHVTRFSNTPQGAIRQKAYGFRNTLVNQLRETRNRMR